VTFAQTYTGSGTSTHDTSAVIYFVIIIVFLGASLVGAYIRNRRRATAENVAARAGMDYSFDDPFNCTRVAFALFRKGDGRGAENVMWRDGVKGQPVRAFDYWYYTEHRNESGAPTRAYHRFSCAMTLVGGSWPPLTITREGLLDKVVDTVAANDIDLESEEFNRTFVLHCEDRKFAVTLLDPRMMELVLKTKGELNFELRGRWLLVWATNVKPALLPGLAGVADQFVDRIPKVIWDLYPSSFVDAEGKPLPAGDEHLLLDEMMRREDEREHEHADPYDVLSHSPFDALNDDSRPEYDLDGHIVPPVTEDPWGPGLPEHKPQH